MAKNATRFKMAMHLNRSGKNIRYENFRISYKMLLKNNKYIYINKFIRSKNRNLSSEMRFETEISRQ